MRTLTTTEFVEMVKDMDSHSFAGVTTEKVEKTLKNSRVTGLPVTEKITSRTVYNPAVGLTYRNTVNNRLEKEGKEKDFVPQQLPWGEWVGSGSTIIENKGKFYLRLSLVGANGTEKRYFRNGNAISKSAIEDILPAKKQNTNDHQGLENPVIVINVNIETITRIAINGEEYRIAEPIIGTLVTPDTDTETEIRVPEMVNA